MPPPPIKLPLDDTQWTVRCLCKTREVPLDARRPLRATTPGCVHLDLIRAGLIQDPSIGFNELNQLWVGRADWEYRTVFRVEPDAFKHERIDLVCEGLDTVATISLNGVHVGNAANMFHPHRFDITRLLKRPTTRSKYSSNSLVIRFHSPLAHIREQEARLGTRPVNGDWDPYIFIRKAACNFGWDWGPKVPTVGIWRPIYLHAWSGARIVSLRPLVTRADKRRADMDVHVQIERANSSATSVPLHIDTSLYAPGKHAAPLTKSTANTSTNHSVIHLSIPKPSLWWPRGHGPQPLYSLRVALRAGAIIDRLTTRIGLRTVRLNTSPDRFGSKFQFEVNGKPIFAKGANWIPDDLFPTRITPARLRRRIKQAADANMNMLRIWGGGYYENAEFYDACDRLGIMVWHDFMFACAMYPEEPPFPALIEAEARHQVARLASHPSIVLWCGGNECVWGWQKWGWKERLKPNQSWGAAYYFDLLPRIVSELNPTVPYWANSPLSSPKEAKALSHDVLDPNHGDRHTWDAQFDEYRNTIPRFLSEFGRQAPAAINTLRDALGDAALHIDSPALQHRQRATGGNPVIYDAALQRFGLTPKPFREWHRVTQELQSRALKTACEWAIKNKPRCMGVLIWQLNDCWPALSWSLIDSAGRLKPAYHVVKGIFARTR